MRPRASSAVVFVLVCLFGAGVARSSAASLQGKVVARDGSRVPLARLTLSPAGLDGPAGEPRVVVSGDLGAYQFVGLPPGLYDLSVEAPGFQTTVARGTRLEDAGSVATLDVVLDVEAVQEELTVLGQAPRDSLEAMAIRESGARDVGEALASTPGVWKIRKGAIANDVVVRGLQARDLNVLIDGQRVYGACPNHMDPPAFHVDFAEVERVEVGKGPFDVRNQGSLGAVVNVVTRRPEAGWHATTALGGGSRGFVNPSATLSFGASRASVLAGGSYRRADPYRAGDGRSMTEVTNFRPDAIDSDAFRVATGWARGSVVLGAGHSVQAAYTSQRADHVLYPYLMMDALYDDTDRVSARYEHGTAGWLNAVNALAYVTRVDHWMTDEFRTSSSGMARAYSMGTMAATRTGGGRAEIAVGRATLGVEGSHRRWNTRTELAGMAYLPQASIPDATIDTVGAFADYRADLSPVVSLEVGGRLDRAHSAADASLANTSLYFAYKGTRSTSRADWLPAASARLAWRASAATVTASIGHTARVAEANERYFALRRMGGDWVGNPNLAPARNTGVDVSVSLTRGGAQFSASGFVSVIDDYIAVHEQRRLNAVPGVANQRARSYANVDARQAGGEAALSVPINGRIFASLDASYVRGTQVPVPALDINSTVLAEMPPFRGRARLRYDDGRVFLLAEEEVTADQNRVDPDLGETSTGGYAVTNLAAGWRHRRLSATVGVTNLLDRYYVEPLAYQRDPFRLGVRLPEPGRQWYANLSWRF
jgi:iron complex outermembrane receptor protein